MGNMKDVKMNNAAEVLAVTTLGHIRDQMADLPADLKTMAESSIPTIAALAAEFNAAIEGTGVNPAQVTATQERFLNRLAGVAAGAVAQVQERLAGVNKAMTLPQQNVAVLLEYRAQMCRALGDEPGAVLAAYYDAADEHDDTTMQAIEQAPKWDKLFALSDDQRQNGRRIRWPEQAKAAEALDELRFHIISVTEAVKAHITAVLRDDPLDLLDE